MTLIFTVFSEITYSGERSRLVSTFALMGLAAAFVQVLLSYRESGGLFFYQTISVDGFSLFFKQFFIVLCGFSIVSVGKSKEIPEQRRPEYYVLILAACLAMCVAASATELLLAFVSLQAIYVLGYLLAGLGKGSLRSTEAGLKFLVFSAVSSVCFLYASGVLFSATHTLGIYEIHKSLVASPLPRTQALIVFMLFVVALGFQIAAFPLSLWAPDVIEGAPTPVSGFLSVGVPSAGFAVAIRVFISIFTQAAEAKGQWKVLGELQWTDIMTLLAGATMLFGALLSLRQTSAKRMVGCLVIAQSGFLMMGLLVLDELGVASILYNLLVDLFAVLGIFYVISFFFDHWGTDQLNEFKGVLRRAIPESVCLVLFLLCLLGLPPTPGFIGKFTLIGVVIRHNQLSLAIVAIFAMAISTLSVSRLAFSLVGDFRVSTSAPSIPGSVHRKLFLAAILVPVVLVGVFAQFFLSWAGKSLGFIFW